MAFKTVSNRIVCVMALVAVILTSLIVSPPASQDSDGDANVTYEVTLLKNDRFQLILDEEDDSDAILAINGGTYTVEGGATVYVAYRSDHSHGSLIGAIVDGTMKAAVAGLVPIEVTKDMTVLPVEEVEGHTIDTGGSSSADALYIATPDDRSGRYVASITIPRSAATVEVAAHVAGVTIDATMSGNVLNMEITDEVGYRGTLPATVTLHDNNEGLIGWYKAFIFIAGPLVDAQS